MSDQEKEGQGEQGGYLIVTDQKPANAYVLSGEVQLGLSGRLVLLARGRSINEAVDVANMILSRAGGDAIISSVKVGTDQLPTGKYVSRMEITIEKRK